MECSALTVKGVKDRAGAPGSRSCRALGRQRLFKQFRSIANTSLRRNNPFNDVYMPDIDYPFSHISKAAPAIANAISASGILIPDNLHSISDNNNSIPVNDKATPDKGIVAPVISGDLACYLHKIPVLPGKEDSGKALK